MKFRKALSALLAVCTLAGSCITPAAVSADLAEPREIIYGDVNLDEKVDVSDAVMIARFYVMDWGLEITDTGKKQGDVNLDGNLDDDDMLAILQYIARKRTQLGVKEERQEQKYNSVNLTEAVAAGEAVGKEADEAFISSQMKLTVDLFREAAADQQSEGKDVLISPLSVSQALAMTANGADGETKTEMEKLLGDTLDIDTLNQYYYDYTERLTGGEDPALHLANSLWVNKDENRIKVPQAFLQTTKDYYHAEAFSTPFDDSTVKDVNNWVNFHTHEMIPKLLEKCDPEWVMMLVNALAFEAEWSEPYERMNIRDTTFHAYDGDMTVEMMSSEEGRYISDENAVGFIKPYKGGQYSFAAVLPNENMTVSQYVDAMTPESLQKLLGSATNDTVYARLPKFTYDYDLIMNKGLQDLGMKKAFLDADFSQLSSNGHPNIDMVLHKTFIQVDERGTKAGAVTAVMLAECVAEDPPQPKYVYLDRPFIYMILDRKTNLPVFIGYVLHPTAVEAE